MYIPNKARQEDPIKSHQDYLLDIVLKVLGQGNCRNNSEKLRYIGSHYCDFLGESRARVSDLVFGATSIDDYVRRQPDSDIAYVPSTQ